jgi:Domain of unknown function (DUF1844)
MAEDDTGFKVADRRIFTAEGELRDAGAEPPPLDQNVSSKPSSQILGQPEAVEELPMDFQALVFSLSTAALLQLGLAPNPATNKVEKDLPAAKQTISILEVLQDKTKGNLTSEEARLLEECVYDLKMSYVRLVQHGKL